MNLQQLRNRMPIRSSLTMPDLLGNLKTEIGTLSSTPLANLRAAVSKVQGYYESKQPMYDSVAIGLANVEPLYADAAVARLDFASGITHTAFPYVEVDRETLLKVLDALSEAAVLSKKGELSSNGASISEIFNTLEGMDEYDFSFSDADGYMYTIIVDLTAYEQILNGQVVAGDIAVFDTLVGRTAFARCSSGKYYMRNEFLSRGYASSTSTLFQHRSIANNLLHLANLTLPQAAASRVRSGNTLVDKADKFINELGLTSSDSRLMKKVEQIYIEIGSRYHFSTAPYHSVINRMLAYAILSVLDFQNKITDVPKPYVSMIKDLVLCSEINATLIDLCSAALSSQPAQRVSALITAAQDKSKTVKSVLNNAWKSFLQGGIRGLVKYIINYLRGGSTLYGDDGRIQFTNNSTFIPKEFIAGLVGTIVETVINTIALIAAAMRNIIVLISALVVSMVSSLFNSIKSTHDDVRTSVLSSEDENSHLTILPYTPYGLGRIQVTPVNASLFEMLLNTYQSCGGPFTLDVPGGCLFVGPIEVDNDTSEVTIFGAEFHAAAILLDNEGPLRQNSWAQLQLLESIVLPIFDENGKAILSNLAACQGNNVVQFWKEIIKRPKVFYRLPVNDETGHLSDQDDLRLATSQVLCSALFLLWYAAVSGVFNAYQSTDRLYFSGSAEWASNENTAWMISRLEYFYLYVADITTSEAPWKDLASYYTYMQDVNYFFLGSVNNNPCTASFMCTNGYLQDVVDHYYDYSANSLESEVKYQIIPPTYNSSTYWSWVILAGLVTTIAAAAIVVATVAFSKFAKHKRADNKARFDAAASDYNDALQGRKAGLDAQGHVVYEQFDTHSAAGKAYIKQCWRDYKRTAFTNNIWATIIGGSRYDVGTFWGEKESQDDTDSSTESGIEAYAATQLQSDDLETVSDPDSLPVIDTETHLFVNQNSGVKAAVQTLSNQESDWRVTAASLIESLYEVITGHSMPVTNPNV